MIIESQDKLELQKIRNMHYEKFDTIVNHILTSGTQFKYFYQSLAIEEAWNKFKNSKIPFRHEEYQPNPYHYQYDLELYIFLHYEELLKREYELRSGYSESREIKILDKYGLTGLKKEDHVANASRIRWPIKELNGVFIDGMAITPWLMDYFYGISNYKDVIMFGGGGQGKTFYSLSFMCLIYDYFINTKHGAQCTFSTVSESKLKSSSWRYINSLYPIQKNRYKFSSGAGLAIKGGGDYTFSRLNHKGKIDESSGTLVGVLLAKGRQDSYVIDKLTGYHSPEARVYLLDEAQSTDDAPISAYPNMFMHPKYGWFNMSGNYDLPTDLLGINVEANIGNENIDEKTHMWEGTLKNKAGSLHQNTLVIHYNNDLSPGVTDSEYGRKYRRFIPTIEKRDKNYPTEESRNTIGYKRFWIGFMYEKENDSKKKVITTDLLSESNASNKLPPDFLEYVTFGSFDSAPASVDRNVFTTFGIGTTQDGLPMVYPIRIKQFPKPKSDLKYYKESCDNIIKEINENGIQKGHLIMDWTSRSAHIEMLAERGYPCHHLIYQEKIPDKYGYDKTTGEIHERIELDVVPSFVGTLQKNITHYADESLADKITLGAYVMRMFIEKGRVRGINSTLLAQLETEGFEKELCIREFKTVKRSSGLELVCLESKKTFKETNGFSPDILDTFFQFFYAIYAIYGLRPNKQGLGKLRKINNKNNIDKHGKLWEIKRSINL